MHRIQYVAQLKIFTSSSVIIETVKIVNLQGIPSKELASELDFGFPIETLGKNLNFILSQGFLE